PHHLTPDVISSGFWFGVHVLFAVSLLGGIFGTLGIFAHHSPHTRWSGLAGMVLIVAALTLIFGLNYWEAFINPVVAVEAPVFVEAYGAGEGIGWVAAVFPASGALFVGGYLLLCLDVARAKTLPPGSAWLTIAGVVVFGAGLSGFLPMLVVQVGSVLFALGLAWMGLALWEARKQHTLLPTEEFA
ncbi:MAG: hypothetical protein R3247_17725, partial [Rhodothermales bacterium]|nr:hypothetical protein [Rhodothermales bacterium]